MNRIPSLLLASALAAAVGCGGESNTAAPAAPAQAPQKVDLQITVDQLPNPCLLLPLATATQMLAHEEPRQDNLANQKEVARICNYTVDADGSERSVFLKLSVFPTDLMSSAFDSRDELIATATELTGGIAPTAVIDDLGVISFMFDKGEATRLQVLTGLGGANPNTGQPVSELQLGYALVNGALDPEQRQQLLLQQARSNIAQMQPAQPQ